MKSEHQKYLTAARGAVGFGRRRCSFLWFPQLIQKSLVYSFDMKLIQRTLSDPDVDCLRLIRLSIAV